MTRKTEREKIKDFVISLMWNDKESRKKFSDFIKKECFKEEYKKVIKLYKKGWITKEESYRLMTSDGYKEREKTAIKKYYNLLKKDPVSLYKNLLTNIYFDTFNI